MARVKPTYPDLLGVTDVPTQQSLKKLWERAFNHTNEHAGIRTRVELLEASLAEANETIITLTNNTNQALLGPDIGTRRSTGGNANPTPLPPDTHPNHADVVAQAKLDLQAAAIDLTGNCGAFQITKLVAWRLMSSEPNVGILFKDFGIMCDNYAVAIIVYNDGLHYDILQDAGNLNGPQWTFDGPINPVRWRAPIPPAI